MTYIQTKNKCKELTKIARIKGYLKEDESFDFYANALTKQLGVKKKNGGFDACKYFKTYKEACTFISYMINVYNLDNGKKHC